MLLSYEFKGLKINEENEARKEKDQVPGSPAVQSAAI